MAIWERSFPKESKGKHSTLVLCLPELHRDEQTRGLGELGKLEVREDYGGCAMLITFSFSSGQTVTSR